MQKNIDRKFHIDHKYYLSPLNLNGLILYQIGERFYSRDKGFEKHEQLCYELTYISNGTAINEIDNKKYLMTPGTFNFTFPNQIHSIYAKNENLRYFYLGFSLTKKHPLYNDYKDLVEKKETIYVKDFYHTNNLFIDAIKHIDEDSNLSKFIVENCINQILCDFLRAQKGETQFANSKISNSEVILFNLLSIVDEKYLSIDNLEEISEQVGYSTSYLSHIFKSYTQIPINEYILDKKLTYGYNLLKNNENSVTEVAQILHYNSIHSFSKAFKKKFGVSPSNIIDKCLIK